MITLRSTPGPVSTGTVPQTCSSHKITTIAPVVVPNTNVLPFKSAAGFALEDDNDDVYEND
jgi:hypothetical protein